MAEIVNKTDQLVAAVRDLTAVTEANEQALRDNADAVSRVAASNRRHRFALTLTIIGLVLDLVLSVLVIVSLTKQSCAQNELAVRQHYNDRFFHAEFAKVSGQIKGLDEMAHAKSKAQSFTGFYQFRSASQHYLDVIGKAHRQEVADHLGHC